jgi:hypothetical protein
MVPAPTTVSNAEKGVMILLEANLSIMIDLKKDGHNPFEILQKWYCTEILHAPYVLNFCKMGGVKLLQGW